jgi:hypothetical protein
MRAPRPRSLPSPIRTRPAAYALTREHTCAIGDGRLFCWGGNDGALAPREVVRRAVVHEQFGITRGTMRTLTVLR